VFYADLASPWAHVAAHRLRRERENLDLSERVAIDIRAFPLELINETATSRTIFEAEIPVAGAIEPEAGWQMWQGAASEFPVTTLLALEAVEAAKEQGLVASENLDRALRVALYGRSVNISMRYEILAVAATCDGLDADHLRRSLVAGTARAAIENHLEDSLGDEVQGSPHLFTADGYQAYNPGIEMHWEGEPGIGFSVVDRDDPSVYTDILRHAAR